MTKKDLYLIGNFTERNLQPVNQFIYISPVLKNEEELKLNQKIINRNVIINELLDEENEENEIFMNIDSCFIPTVSFELFSKSSSAFSYNKIEDVYIYVLKELEKITTSNSIIIHPSNILHKISQLQYIINIKSMMGMGNTIICGLNAYSELIKFGVGVGSFDKNRMYNIYKMNVISSDLISRNKIIVSKFGNSIESGLNIILDEKVGKFCVFTTHCWENNICWFEIN